MSMLVNKNTKTSGNTLSCPSPESPTMNLDIRRLGLICGFGGLFRFIKCKYNFFKFK